MKKKLVSILLISLTVLMVFSIEKVLAVNVIKNGGFEEGELYEVPLYWDTGDASTTTVHRFGEQGCAMYDGEWISQELAIPTPVSSLEDPFGFYAVSIQQITSVRVDFTFTDLTTFNYYYNAPFYEGTLEDEEWEFFDIKDLLLTYHPTKTIKIWKITAFSCVMGSFYDEIGNPYIEEEEEEPYNWWGWLKWLLALIVFIIIVSFAIYVKGGRR